MKTLQIAACAVLFLIFVATSSEAGWLIYHEPEFNGKILDIDTKQPIEGAVVVTVYKKKNMGLGASMSAIMDVRETLTDKDGNFHIPSYTTFIQPFSWQIPTSFIIYKPGYASLELGAYYFTGEETREREGSWPGLEFKGLKYRLRGPGIAELPKLVTREQRINAKPSPAEDSEHKSNWYWNKQKLLIKAIRNEWQYLYNEDPGNLYKTEERYYSGN